MNMLSFIQDAHENKDFVQAANTAYEVHVLVSVKCRCYIKR